jgi:hypothetical protein
MKRIQRKKHKATNKVMDSEQIGVLYRAGCR